MQQLPLTRDLPAARSAPTPFDEASEELLGRYRALRFEAGANARSVTREVSQLRAVAREAGPPGSPLPLLALLKDLRTVARALTEPRAAIARSTGQARLVAVQRLITVIGPTLGRDAESDLRRLDALLPARPRAGWHEAGTLVAGGVTRQRWRGPSLSGHDLHRIVDAAASDEDDCFAMRDRALVALHCFSGLRPEEIVRLRWCDVTIDRDGDAVRVAVIVMRRGSLITMPIIGTAETALDTLAHHTASLNRIPTAYVFRGRTSGGDHLSYRMSRMIVARACRAAGYPPLEASDLRAAYAHWLGTRGLSDHEVAAMLGVARVRTVDALRTPHLALDAQRAVRERLG
jgi:integrase